MKFTRAFRLAGYCLLFSGFITLFAAGGVSLTLAAVYLAVVGWRAWREISAAGGPEAAGGAGSIHGMELKNWQQLILVILTLTFFVIDFSVISGFVAATIHLLVLISLLKVFSRKNEKDYLLIYFISFAFLLLASTFTISVLFFASLLVYIFFSILTFVLFESRRAYEENPLAHFALRGYAGVASLMTLLIVLISVPIFVTIPRGSFGLFGGKRQQQNLSGFSDRVSLGDIGRIIQNPSIVMRVRVDRSLESLPEEMKWRGIALDRYDGRTWSNTGRERDRLRPFLYQPGWKGFLVAEKRRQREFQVQQTFLLEPFTNVVFAAPDVIGIQTAGTRNQFLIQDGNDSFTLSRSASELFRYTVYSDVISRNERLGREAEEEYPAEIQEVYLQLSAVHPEVLRLARRITEKIGNDLGKALAIESFLKQNYGYSLANLPGEASDPLYDFLFVSRAGHCEYFATAQAILMRAVGIPARLVNGFHRGEFNTWSDYFIVRQSDAHSWVEGYLPGVGWVEFDPTVAGPPGNSAYWFRLAGQLLDAVDVFWTEVITFDRIKQAGLFRAAASNLRQTWSRLSTLSETLAEVRFFAWWEKVKERQVHWVVFLLPLLVGAAGAGVTYRYRRYFRYLWRQRVLKQKPWELAPEFYLEMLEVLQRKGVIRKPSETPGEFARRVRALIPSRVPLRLTDLYYHNRFGNFPLRGKDLSEIHSSLRELRRTPVKPSSSQL